MYRYILGISIQRPVHAIITIKETRTHTSSLVPLISKHSYQYVTKHCEGNIYTSLMFYSEHVFLFHVFFCHEFVFVCVCTAAGICTVGLGLRRREHSWGRSTAERTRDIKIQTKETGRGGRRRDRMEWERKSKQWDMENQWKTDEREVCFNGLVCIQVVAGGFSKLLHVVNISPVKDVNTTVAHWWPHSWVQLPFPGWSWPAQIFHHRQIRHTQQKSQVHPPDAGQDTELLLFSCQLSILPTLPQTLRVNTFIKPNMSSPVLLYERGSRCNPWSIFYSTVLDDFEL